ncbi:MAG: hypothetical protein AAGD96_27765, partial [Chloroflexota bacterium]
MNGATYFRKLILLACVLLTLLACQQAEPDPTPIATVESTASAVPTQTQAPTASIPSPTATPINTPLPAATTIPVWFEGVFADVPDALGQLDDPVTIESNSELDPNNSFPLHEQYVLQNWQVDSELNQARILAFPLRDYASLNIKAQLEIEHLQALIDRENELDAQSSLPFLPVSPSSQALHALPKYQPFKSGLGIRYIAWYPAAQEIEQPIELLYVWQGITTDGRGLISAAFPIQVENIPESSEDLLAEPASFSEWSTLLAESISEASPDAFTPPLAEIDSLINSIQANLPRP